MNEKIILVHLDLVLMSSGAWSPTGSEFGAKINKII